MTDDCPACARAEERVHSGLYHADCLSCQARAIAKGPEAHAREADPSALQAVLRKVWPTEDDYRRGRTLVWRWIKRKG